MTFHADISPPSSHTIGLLDQGLRAVESCMRSLIGSSDDTVDIAQRAVLYHLDSGGGRTRAAIGLAAADALQIVHADSIAVAACAELLHNASLIHDDLQDQSQQRRGQAAVWKQFGESIAICAGDLLVSAAYASLAATTIEQKLGEFINAAHAATSLVIAGQARDLSLQDASLTDFAVYQKVAGAKSGPLLGLPLELTLIAAGYAEYRPAAREAAKRLAVAYQIADDLADQETDAGGENQPGCLNAVAVLRNGGCSQPAVAAKTQALVALEQASEAASTLPLGSGSSLLNCMESIDAKLAAVLL